MISWPDVVAIAPELSATDPQQQTALLAIVERWVNPTTWGILADDGSRYLAAHLATIGRLRGTGAVTNEVVGQLSRAYLSPKGLEGVRAWLGQSSYGAVFYGMLAALPTSVGTVV